MSNRKVGWLALITNDIFILTRQMLQPVNYFRLRPISHNAPRPPVSESSIIFNRPAWPHWPFCPKIGMSNYIRQGTIPCRKQHLGPMAHPH